MYRCRLIFNDIFCIHEAADLHFDSGEFTVRRNYPHRYIDINGKIIYVPSEDDSFYDQKKLKSIVDSTVVKEERPIDKRYFIIYDLKDSCEKVSYPFFSDSIYEYEPNSITPIFTKDEQTTHIHFVNIKPLQNIIENKIFLKRRVAELFSLRTQNYSQAHQAKASHERNEVLFILLLPCSDKYFDILRMGGIRISISSLVAFD